MCVCGEGGGGDNFFNALSPCLKIPYFSPGSVSFVLSGEYIQ